MMMMMMMMMTFLFPLVQKVFKTYEEIREL